jgi:RNA polymerase sigma factor (sigma-70 family)
MNILELDSYNLADAVKFNDQLNPRLWGSDEHLQPEVREQLLRIAEDFRESLGISDLDLRDITISGSNAAYTYTPNSDIDLHLVVDVPDDEVYRELFNAKKFQYNEQHDITIGGADVELYVQDNKEPHISQGVYSVLNNAWLSVPRRVKSVVDDTSTRNKFETVGHQIERVIKSGNIKRMSRLIDKIKKMRQTGLENHGEFGPENLAFKMLRSQGLIQDLYDARNGAKDKEFSLKEKAITPKVTYGFKTPVVVEIAPDKSSEPLPSDEEILKDFIKFCVEELKIKQMPTVKLRKDPQWSVRNRTFGRYINDQHLLEVAWGGRHIMDVLRTVAHELTHKHQHERDGSKMDNTAGETGSPWENEANARAGILMRDYARMHPDYFAVGQAEDLKEANPNQQLSLYRPDGTTYRGEKMPVLDPDDFHSDTNPRKRVDQVTHQDLANRTATDLVDPIEKAEQNIDRERLKAAIRASMSSLTSNETAVLNMRFWKDLTLAQTAKALNTGPERIRQIEAKALRKLRHESRSDRLEPFVKESASGYIPTKKQAKDPRFSMALTKDIRPGQLGKEANKLKLKTDSQGQPQVANPNGLFEKLALELAQFKRTPVAESVAQLAEVRMAPSNLMQWATSKDAQGIRAGFEAELIFRDTQRNDDDDYEMEPDYDADERCRSLGQVVDFFESGDYGLGSRQAERLREQLDEAYYEWYDEQMHRDFKEEAEDLIRKVIVDEGDWDEDNEIQKQLELLDLTDDEMNDIIKAGERAPKFTSSKEQILYAEANPLYQKYLDAQEEAEGLLDDLVADEVRKEGGIWDAALEDFRDNYSLDDDSGFFDDAGLRWMSDVASEYDLDWPYMTGGNSGTGSRSWDSIGDSLNGVVDMPVKVSSGYHNAARREGQWIVEPDSSLQPDDSDDMGLEIVSPPMPLLVALNKLQQVTDWANSNEGNAYTNSSTGLHMGVSVPFKGGDVDYLKLILFLGDEYVLKQFGREANTYTKSAMSKFRENIRGGRADPAGAMKLMQSGLIELAHREIQKGVGDGKYTSAHIQKGYIEFRSAGGDWLAEENANPEILQTTMLRYARAMSLAANPSEERREYAKKLYKLVAPEGDSELALFSQYAAGELTAEQLKKRWAEKAIGAEKKMNQRWRLYQNVDGRWEPVPGAEWNGYPEDEVKMRVYIKYGREALDSGEYKLVNMSEDQQWEVWEVYDVKTGKTLEIVKAKNKGEAADAVYDKYVEQGIGFNVRPYEDPATMTPRAKLAKRIATKKPIDYNYEIVNLGDVNLGVVDRFYADSKQEADKTFDKWLEMKGLPNDTDTYGYRPRKQETAVKDAEPDVAQNFGNDPMSAYERNSDRIDAIRQDATNRVGSWSIYDVTLGREISRMNDVPWSQADARADELERSTGHNMSVHGLSETVAESLLAKNLNQLYKIKQQLAHPALGTAPPEPAPRAEPVRPTQPRVSAALADLERQRAKLNKIMDLKQELETLAARAGRTRYGITPGLAADIEDIYPEPKSEADMDAMLQGYEIQKKKLTDYIARQRKVFPKESVEEGEVVPFRRPQAQPLLPQDVLHLANEWFWANDDTNTLQAVTDQGYGQGAENLVKYIQAQLQSKGWTIDFDDEIDNIVLTNRSGQTVALPVSDAYDGTGWATGTLSENFEDGRGPGRPGDSQRHGIPKGATIAQLEKASHAKGRKGQLARWQLNMRRGKKK